MKEAYKATAYKDGVEIGLVQSSSLWVFVYQPNDKMLGRFCYKSIELRFLLNLLTRVESMKAKLGEEKEPDAGSYKICIEGGGINKDIETTGYFIIYTSEKGVVEYKYSSPHLGFFVMVEMERRIKNMLEKRLSSIFFEDEVRIKDFKLLLKELE